MQERITYEYVRSKAIIDDADLGKVFVGFCCLSIEIVQKFANRSRTKLITGAGFSYYEPIENIPPQLLNLPTQDDAFTITEYEYELLDALAEKDELAFWLYRTTIENTTKANVC